MRLIIAHEERFVRAGGTIYSANETYSRTGTRYLGVFESVHYLARVQDQDSPPKGWEPAEGPNVGFIPLPNYRGPWQYLGKRRAIAKVCAAAVDKADAFILRVPGTIAGVLWRYLRQRGKPYGMEVEGDPWLSFAPGSVRSIVRPYIRRRATRELKEQCADADALIYVTRTALQESYPPGPRSFSIHASCVELPDDFIVTDCTERIQRARTIPRRLRGDGPPARLGFIGTFSQLYKAPDIHLRALAACRAKGLNVEMVMVGDGSYLDEMRALAAKLNIEDRVEFTGRLPAGETIFRLLDGVDLFLNASRQDGLPRALVEAMARGCPAVGSRIAGIPELLGEPFLVEPNDIEGLATAIERSLSDADTLEQAIVDNVRTATEYRKSLLTQRRRQFLEQLRDRTQAVTGK